jgi:hypothetical protein
MLTTPEGEMATLNLGLESTIYRGLGVYKASQGLDETVYHWLLVRVLSAS